MRVFIPGGNGYVGSKLTHALWRAGHHPVVLDLHYRDLPLTEELTEFKADVRNNLAIKDALTGCNAVIHLACLSNDPTAEQNPALTKSINLDSFLPLVEVAKDAGVKRFIYASSSSVYGVKDTKDVTEDLPLEPLTDYSKYKAMCETILLNNKGDMEAVIVRPATICGYAPNMRLDLLVHILTRDAVTKGIINVHGGHQYRPNIHIDDMVDCYIRLLEAPAELIDGQIFNAGYRNMTILETAELIKSIVGNHVQIIATESTDPRSYHVNSDKIKRELSFEPKRTVESAIEDVMTALRDGRITNPDDDRYYRNQSIKKMELVA